MRVTEIGLRLASEFLTEGYDAVNGEVPYRLALMANERVFCSGNMVNLEWFVTSAACNLSTNYLALYGNVSWQRGIQVGIREKFNMPQYNAETQAYDIAAVKVSSPFTPSEFAKPIRLAKAGSYKDNALAQLGGWSEVKNLQLTQYKTGCSFAPGMTSTHFCATPTDQEWCAQFNEWEMVSNEELAGVIEGSEEFDNGNMAKDACIQEPFCTGVAFKDGSYTLRKGQFRVPSQGVNVFLKPARYCREPGDIELCTPLDKWIYGEGMYLGGYPPSTGLVEKDTLEEAQITCLMTNDCGGVTSVNNNSKFQLRRSTEFRPGNNENSWLKPFDPCPFRKKAVRIGACDEDAGGALVTIDDNDEAKITGIMSFADPSCDASLPVVFTDITQEDINDWLHETAWIPY